MSTLGERLDAAIKRSGRSREQIAEEARTTDDHISRITTGKHDNLQLHLLIRLALAAKTTVGALLGESIQLSAEDEEELLRFRGWIDDKLMTIDARAEPNAVIVNTQVPMEVRADRVADRPRRTQAGIANPFDLDTHLVLRAVGASMTGSGILPGDTLYAIAAPGKATTSAIARLIACRLNDNVFVKRLVSEHGRLYLLSAHPRYRPIAIDAAADSFEILGIVIGRVGRLE